MKRTIAGSVLTMTAVATFLLGTATPANAVGNKTMDCTRDAQTTGSSSRTNGGFTTDGVVCGTAGVRLVYGARGEPQRFYGPWAYSTSVAHAPHPGSGVIVYGGQHGVSNPSSWYNSAKNYTT